MAETKANENKAEKTSDITIQKSDEVKKEDKTDDDEFKLSVTYHTIEVNGQPLRYKACAGRLKMHDDRGKHLSHIFFISYEKEISEKEREKRPLTFAFNGGPGAPAIWVHFGALGPKRVEMTEDGDFLPPPFTFTDNNWTWLEFTDLVFIDPVGTGFSDHPPEQAPEQFFGVKEDIESVGEFIRLYITRFKRWLSPKIVAGESYGTTRAAGLSLHLQEKLGIDLSGIVLISSVLDFATIRYAPHHDLPYALVVPSYTATAWYHKKLPPRLMENLEETLREVETWVLDEYIPALAQGCTLPPDRFDEIAGKLAEYTGLSEKYVKMSNLRILNMRYMKEFLRDEYRTIGRLDTRFKGIDADSVGEFIEYDPSLLTGSFVAAVSDYMRRVLKFETDKKYNLFSAKPGKHWNWTMTEGYEQAYPSVADMLRSAIHRNPYLKVLVCSGYFDIGTPYFAMKYSVDHLKLDPALRGNIILADYIAGHMVYYPKDMLIKFTEDVKSFISMATSQTYRE